MKTIILLSLILIACNNEPIYVSVDMVSYHNDTDKCICDYIHFNGDQPLIMIIDSCYKYEEGDTIKIN